MVASSVGVEWRRINEAGFQAIMECSVDGTEQWCKTVVETGQGEKGAREKGVDGWVVV